ncbi:butyrophilin subfamily 3 member A2 [Dicentrarchus labrax]|uniref:butyrophilin subfamily 3 member A2 n=1 Tax=Dicentrarchus labrax TaxID=13489 RepID=UPI0021F552F8|nr:butyrophilin subfamily 3 member A2 [Dicentrarchus labrax]
MKLSVGAGAARKHNTSPKPLMVSLQQTERAHLCAVGMHQRLLLIATLTAACTGNPLPHGPPEQVLAFAGEAVILPCSFSPTGSDDFPTVEWSKEDLQPNVVFLYRDGCETYEMKDPLFQYRTSFIPKELKNRNVSLRISNVQLSDAGKYQCKRLWKNGRRDITTVELSVAAVSEPKLSVLSADSGGVTLQCKASCWLPEPKIQFLDDQGNNISAEDPKRDQNASGCYTVTQKVTLQDATNSVTCRVYQPDINQTRDTQILIPVDCMRSCSLAISIAVAEGIILLLALCGLAVFLCKRCDKSEGQKKKVTRQPSDQSTMSGTSQNKPLLQTVEAHNVRNSDIEELKKELADVNSKLHEKEETIRQLENKIKPQLSPVVCYQDQPTTVCSPSKCPPDIPKPLNPPYDNGQKARNGSDDHNPKSTASTSSNPQVPANLFNKGQKPVMSRQNSDPKPVQRKRIHSLPDNLVTDVAVPSFPPTSTLKKKLGHISRSMSDSYTDFGPNVPKVQRRLSLVLPSSNNRFAVLSGLQEEKELLYEKD